MNTILILIRTRFRTEQWVETGNDVILFSLNFNTAVVRDILEEKTQIGGHFDIN